MVKTGSVVGGGVKVRLRMRGGGHTNAWVKRGWEGDENGTGCGVYGTAIVGGEVFRARGLWDTIHIEGARDGGSGCGTMNETGGERRLVRSAYAHAARHIYPGRPGYNASVRLYTYAAAPLMIYTSPPQRVCFHHHGRTSSSSSSHYHYYYCSSEKRPPPSSVCPENNTYIYIRFRLSRMVLRA